MKIIISGGGTGGHIYPALTIARAISDIQPADILFVGTRQGLEADIVPKEGFPFATVDAGGLERRLTWGNLRALGRTVVGLFESFALLRRFRPDIVIGTGGYVCGPVLLAAGLLGIPALIQEQNVIPGVTNRILARFVAKIAAGYDEAAPNFGVNRDKVVVTGNPVRREILTATRAEGLQALGLAPDRLTLLVAGGSRGARSINTAMADVHARFAGRPGIQILHATGSGEYNNIVGLLGQRGIDPAKTGNISIVPYLYNMPHALAAADLALFRAGAVGLAELAVRGIPSVLIPYPYAAENHQEFNARVLERRGAAVVIRDADLSGGLLADTLETLLGDPARLGAMAAASRALGRPGAAAAIAALAVDLAGRR
jgi:UDP-N-acetylglucosamine--N-acetylmuramyl-(pentapeptide) pyrophosphoryl-undecaprenol N-acetylglucosamine transferase